MFSFCRLWTSSQKGGAAVNNSLNLLRALRIIGKHVVVREVLIIWLEVQRAELGKWQP